jgi:hypothetical protein
MILIELKQYMQQHDHVALIDLVNHFTIEAEVVEEMLEKFIKKGKIELLNNSKGCGTLCCKCDERLIKIYKWRKNE